MSLKAGDIVNVKKSGGGYWKGKITEVSPEWTHTLKNGEVLRAPYTNPIATANAIGGQGHAVFMEHQLKKENGEWWQR